MLLWRDVAFLSVQQPIRVTETWVCAMGALGREGVSAGAYELVRGLSVDLVRRRIKCIKPAVLLLSSSSCSRLVCLQGILLLLYLL